MRNTVELATWKSVRDARASLGSRLFSVENEFTIDLNSPCTVLGGKNGSGKSRSLRKILESGEPNIAYIDLHRLCEHALLVLRNLTEIDEMKEELGEFGPDSDRLSDVNRVIGKDYEKVSWYSLDIGPSDESVASSFLWGGSPESGPITPYFIVRQYGMEYDALQMGMGEFSVHFLFWILEQYKDQEELLLLLDEPDAYLPPVGIRSLLDRLLALCRKRGWRMVISSHSEEIISTAVENDSFILLRRKVDGQVESLHSKEDRSIADLILSRPQIERVLFVEDESALHLCRALLKLADPSLLRKTVLVWGDGHGYLTAIQKKIPRSQKPAIRFAMVPDGDQRDKISPKLAPKNWPMVFLPTQQDPDDLFRTLKSDPRLLSESLQVDVSELERKLDSLEGVDSHDWVTSLGNEYGRENVLSALARSWTSMNAAHASEFVRELRSKD
ncbi:ATP-dependent nuclease [Timonella senegalensis]|uniref:ATP-dependent nuclease n=1 Tax=Timonella senegalensis TaxID=1465825 RepID=UPI0028A8E341|nr:ATP-binding protein [Timonella senegalensis]